MGLKTSFQSKIKIFAWACSVFMLNTILWSAQSKREKPLYYFNFNHKSLKNSGSADIGKLSVPEGVTFSKSRNKMGLAAEFSRHEDQFEFRMESR
jgi:hypothetical protein